MCPPHRSGDPVSNASVADRAVAVRGCQGDGDDDHAEVHDHAAVRAPEAARAALRRVARTIWRNADPPPTRRRRSRAAAPIRSPRRRRRRRGRRRRTPQARTAARRSSSALALRHGSTGATAMRNSRASPIGIVSRSKYGAPTLIWRSCNTSTSSGNSGAEQDDEGEHGEQHVVGEERRLAATAESRSRLAIAGGRRATRSAPVTRRRRCRRRPAGRHRRARRRRRGHSPTRRTG